MILEHTRNLLPWETLGCTVVGTADNGTDGADCIHRLRPDVVITDVVMPGQGGLEMIDAVSAEVPCKFIIISGYQEFEYVRHALRAGVVDYLLKPITAADLQEVLMRMLHPEKIEESYDSRYGTVIAKTLRCIDEHYSEPEFSLSWICENELFMNETYVGRLFQKRTDMKFTAWVTRKKLEEAVRLLTTVPDITVGEVAERVGFVTSKYFIEVFKKNMGMSPGQYRQKQMKAGERLPGDG